LGRKVLLEDGRGLKLLGQHIQATIQQALDDSHLELPNGRHERSEVIHLHAHALALQQALQDITTATQAAWASGEPAVALANAVPYMQAFGHTVLAWTWLQVALASQGEGDANLGRRNACQFFFHYELPKIGAWLQVVRQRDTTCADMPESAF
jgi:butyryl-CoA dehydrogenase